MKKLLITLTVATALCSHGATILNETFDNDGGITKSTPFFSDGGSDYLGLTGGTDDYDGDASPTGIPGYSGTTGSFLVGEDLDGEGATLPISLSWVGLNISGQTGLSFSGDIGASTGGIDLPDDLIIEYQIDVGGYTTLLDFDFVSDGDNFNNIFSLAGGTSPDDDLGLALKTFTAPISGTGSTLDLRLTVDLNSGSEEFAVDNFKVTSVPEASAFALIGAAMAGLMVFRRFRNPGAA